MNIEQYLKIEFQAQPSLYRGVSAFLADDDIAQYVRDPERFFVDNGVGVMTFMEYVSSENTKRGKAYFVCGVNGLGPKQPTRYMALWSWLNGKSMSPLSVNPLVRNDLFTSRNNKWANLPKHEASDKWLKWLAELELTILIWKAHRETDDYRNLSREDQYYVDTIGLLQKALKKHAAFQLLQLDISMAEESVQSMFYRNLDEAKRERGKYYPKYQSLLTPVFRYKIKEMLQVN